MIRRGLRGDALARLLWVLSAAMLTFTYGVVAERYDLFPIPMVRNALAGGGRLLEASGLRRPWYEVSTGATRRVTIHAADAMMPGLTLVSGLTADWDASVDVVDARGRLINRWQLAWDAIWPDPTHLAPELIPRLVPAPVHGVALTSSGDLIFNFENLGMVRMNACGEVLWRLPYRTHHSIHVAENGNIWASGEIVRKEPRAALPNHQPPFDDQTIVEVSPDGQIRRELLVADLLAANDLKGLLYLSTIDNWSATVTGDTLHLNDVETFPASLLPGVFSQGDVLISLRNINALIVFNPASTRVKYVSHGAVLRQHDPDFVDGNTISVFDNNPLDGQHSRIVRLSALTETVDVRFSGSLEMPFFTLIMGKHQLLANGNTLLTQALGGRVLEIDGKGQPVWEYVNLIDDGVAGLVGDALRLPPEQDEAFFTRVVSACRPTAAG